MVETNANDSISRRSVLKTAGGVLAGATVITGRASARPDPKPVEIVDVSCDPDGGEITIANSAGFQINPWVEARIVAVNGSYSRSIVLGPGAEATDGGLANGTYQVRTFVDSDRGSRIEDPVLVGEETVEIACEGEIKFDLAFEPREPVVGEAVRIVGNPSRPPDRGLDYYWDVNGDGDLDEATDRPVLEHAYEQPGEYEVELTVELLDESEVTATKPVTVEGG